jgi:phasin family protein
MFPLFQSMTPAVKNHLQAQLSFFNDMSKSLFNSAQQWSAINIQLAQTMMEESTSVAQKIITAERLMDVFSVTASHAQPAADKLRAYQQHLSRLTADTQVELAGVAEAHVPETSRTAKALAEEVAHKASEETEKSMRDQQDMMKQFSDPFQHLAESATQRRPLRATEMRGSDSLQSASGQGSQGGGATGGMQGGAGPAATPQGGRQSGPGRKE